MNFRIASFSFQMTLIPALIVLGLVAVLIRLGFWQLDRAAQRQAILDQVAANTQYVQIDHAQALNEVATYERVQLQGTFDQAHQFLLDNQVIKGRAGFDLLTPLLTDQGAVLVNRGWVLAENRQVDPSQIQIHNNPLTISARVTRPSTGVLLGDALSGDEAKDWPRVVQAADIQALSAVYSQTLANVVLQAETVDTWTSAEVDWQPTGADPNKNLAYALQWFALGFALLLLTAFKQTHRISSEPSA